MTKTNNAATETGTCQICERTCKLPGGTVSLHGYKRPGHGWITGSCRGSHALSWQVSSNALAAFVVTLQNIRSTMEINLAAARDVFSNADETIEIPTWAGRPQAPRTYTRGIRVDGCDMFSIVCTRRIERIEQDIRSITREIDRQAARLASWAPAA